MDTNKNLTIETLYYIIKNIMGRMEKIINVFVKKIPSGDGMLGKDAGLINSDLRFWKKKGYKYNAEKDTLIRSKNKYELTGVGYLSLGLLVVGLLEGVKLLIK